MMREEDWEEARRLLSYEQMCYDLLTVEAISYSHAVEIVRLNKGKVEQRPHRIYAILSGFSIPAFCFIIGKN